MQKSLESRLKALIGEDQIQKRLMVMTGYSQAMVYKWFDTNGFPLFLEDMAHMMERLPPSDWPDRCQQARMLPRQQTRTPPAKPKTKLSKFSLKRRQRATDIYNKSTQGS
jgi:hypothetical protein